MEGRSKFELMQVQAIMEKGLNDQAFLNQFTTRVFENADKDESGDLCLNEFYTDFQKVAGEVGITLPTLEQAQTKFNELDTDKSGKLSQEEYKVFVKEILTLGLSLVNAELAKRN